MNNMPFWEPPDNTDNQQEFWNPDIWEAQSSGQQFQQQMPSVRDAMARFPVMEEGQATLGSLLQRGHKIAHPLMKYFGPGHEEQSTKWGNTLQEAFGNAMQQYPKASSLGELPYILSAGRLGGRLGGPLAAQVGNLFRPSTHLARMGEQYSPEMAERARIAGNTPTPLGDIIRSGPLKKTFENKLPGIDPILTELEQEISRRGESLLGSSIGKDPNEVLGNLIQKEYKKATDIKNSLYSPVNDLAKKEGLNLTLPTASRTARANLKALESSPMLSKDADFASKVKRLFNVAHPTETKPAKTEYSSVLDAFGKPVVKSHEPEKKIFPSIVEAKEVANKLYSSGKRLLKSPDSSDRATGSLYSRVSREIRNDIRNNIEKSGSPELQSAYKEAEKNYKNSFAHYLEKEIYPYASANKDPESIVRQIIKPGKLNDKFKAIEKLNKILPKEKQGLLGQAYLQGATDKHGNFNVSELNSRLRGIGPRQFRILFSPEQQKQIKDFEIFSGMNKEAFNRLLNPHTGKRTADQTSAISEAMQAALAGSVGFAAGGTKGALLSVFARPAYKAGKEALLRKWLTDPAMREAVLKAKQAKLP